MKFPFTIHPSFYFALGILIMKSVALIMLPIVTRYLSPSQFGELELLLSLSDFVILVTGFGLVEAMYRFSGLSKDGREEQKIAATVYTLGATTGSISLILGLLLAPLVLPYLGENTSLLDLQLVVVLFSLEGCIAIPLAWLKMKESAFQFFVLTTGKAIGQSLLTWLLLSNGFGMTSVLLSGVISSVILVILLLRMQWRETGLGLDRELLPKLLVYGMPLTISALAGFALLGTDRWVISMVSSTEELGLYALAAKLAVISSMLMQPFFLWWYPRRFKQLQQENGHVSVAHTTSLGIALVLCFATLICIGSPLLMGTLIDKNYAAAIDYVPAMALFFAIKQIAELANLGSYIGRSTWNITAISLITAAVSLLGFYLLSEPFKVAGVIAALIIAQCFRATLFFVGSQRVLHLNYEKARLLMLSLICLVLVFASQQLTSLIHHLLMALASGVVLMAFLYVSKLFSLKSLITKPPAPAPSAQTQGSAVAK